MQKIPTLFRRDPDDMAHVLPVLTAGCEWVIAGEGAPTRKYDGTCVALLGSVWWARREVKPGKAEPAGFLAVNHDPATGKTVGWEPILQSPFAKFWAEAVSEPGLRPEGTYELLGPKIQGNPEKVDRHRLLFHADAERIRDERLTEPTDADGYDGIREAIIRLGDDLGFEGVVWHHPDGRMAKLKRRDFPQAVTR